MLLWISISQSDYFSPSVRRSVCLSSNLCFAAYTKRKTQTFDRDMSVYLELDDTFQSFFGQPASFEILPIGLDFANFVFHTLNPSLREPLCGGCACTCWEKERISNSNMMKLRINEWMIDEWWMNDWWMNEWMNDWLMNDEWINVWWMNVWWMNEWMNKWMNVMIEIYEWMNEWMDGWMDEWMNGQTLFCQLTTNTSCISFR